MTKVSTTIDSALGVVSRLDSTDSLPALSVSDATFSGNVALGSDSLDTVTINGVMSSVAAAVKLRDIQELTTPLTGAGTTPVVVHDTSLAHIFVHSSIAANFTANLTNLNLTPGYATTLILVLVQGGTAYYPNVLQIEGVVKVINWQGNLTPVPTAGRTDIVTFSIINSGGTYLVYGQLTSF
jgi:hypothetical protein